MADEAGAVRNQVFVQPPPQFRKTSHNHNSDTDVESANSPRELPVYRVYSNRESQQGVKAWNALGERLNIDRANLDELDVRSQNSFEMPFAAQPGTRHLHVAEYVPQVPRAVSYAPLRLGCQLTRQLDEFRGPLDTTPRRPVDLNIVVTSETVVEKD
jgi:hypothetical protein